MTKVITGLIEPHECEMPKASFWGPPHKVGTLFRCQCGAVYGYGGGAWSGQKEWHRASEQAWVDAGGSL